MGPLEIIKSIPDKFQSALDSVDLRLFPSEIRKVEDCGVEFEICLCPALQEKLGPRADGGKTRDASCAVAVEKPNPFLPPYSPNLYVGDLALKDEEGTSEYVVLFNKFPVVPHHFLLVTKEFRSQSSPLLPSDLIQTYQLLLAARQENKHLLAYYNCGPYSGASQSHKHVQFIEVASSGPPIEKLTRMAKLEVSGKPFAIPSLPYANHIYRLPTLSTDSTPEELHRTLFPPFLSLLDLVISTVRHDPEYPSGLPSYNVIMTLEHIHMIPRRHETHTPEGTEAVINVNSLGYAGMLLAKSDSELEAIKKVGPGKILRGVGVESVHDLQVAGASLEADGL
ncbi:ATP adenylyltransferase-domain-containing protein [Scleroderma yunnanense]